MIESAAEQMTALLDQLGVAARIEGGRYEPALVEADTLELARAAEDEPGRRVGTGSGGRRDRPSAVARRSSRSRWPRRATAAWSACAAVDGRSLTLEPVMPARARS